MLHPEGLVHEGGRAREEAIEDAQAGSGKALMDNVAAALEPSDVLGLVDWTEQFMLYLPREVVHFGYRRERIGEVRDAVAWLSAGEDRMDAIIRTGIPYVGTCGALEMINFGAPETVPER